MINIDKIYVCHHKPLIERKEILYKYFKEKNIDVEWVEKYLPEEISDKYDELVGYFNIDPEAKFICYGQYSYFPNVGKKINLGELSLYLKHLYCFEDQIKNNYENILILEDDLLIPTEYDFIKYLNNCIDEFKKIKADMMFLGSCCEIHVDWANRKNNKYVYLIKNQLTRCTHAYVTSIEATKKILTKVYPKNMPIDFKLNEIIIVENLKVAWTEPSFSQNPKFKSELR